MEIQELKKKLSDKTRYYTGQYEKAQDRYLDSGLKRDRDSAMRLREKVRTLKEINEML